MNIASYFEQARSTAIYPKAAKFAYPVLGLVGEMGEFTEKVAGMADKMSINAEVGDVLWYIANTCMDLEYTSSDLVDKITSGVRADTFDDLCGIMGSQAIVPQSITISLGKLGEIGKKAIRDKGGVVADTKREVALDALAEVVKYLFYCSIGAGSLSEAAVGNISKLMSRKERGVIKGDGDNR